MAKIRSIDNKPTADNRRQLGLLILVCAPLFNWAPSVMGDTKEAAELAPVVVTATRTEQQLEDAPAAMTVITQEDLKNAPVRDITDAIRETTGINLFGRGVGSRKVIMIRGMESQHSLILVDGKRINATDDVIGHSDFQYSWLPIEAIERIEIVRGPLSTLYGSEALGGVVNIITKPIGEKWHSTVSLFTGMREDSRGGEEYKANFYATGPLGNKFALSLTGELSKQEKTPLKADEQVSEFEGKEIKSGSLKLSFVPVKQQTLELFLSYVDEERPRNTFSSGSNPVLHESTYEMERTHISLEHRGQFGDLESQARLYRSNFDVENFTTQGVAPTTPQELIDEVFDGHISFPLGESHLLTAGVEYRIETLKHSALTNDEENATHKALFAQDEFDLTDNLLLTLGARLDHHEFFGNETSPRAYLVYHLTKNLTVKGGYGHGFKAPTLKQISPEYQFLGFHSFFGNAELQPETSDNYELSLAYHTKSLTAKATFFHNDIDDLIDFLCITNCTERLGREFLYVNVEEARTKGIETELNLSLPYGFDIALNYTYLEAKDLTNDQRIASRPRHLANFRLAYHNQGFSATLRTEYNGSQIEYDRGNQLDLPAYTLWHFSLRQSLTDSLTLRGGVENIGDVYLAEESDFFGYEERGRFFYVGLEASF
jgi:outer membrane receptor for ferrienterochelin and colicins